MSGSPKRFAVSCLDFEIDTPVIINLHDLEFKNTFDRVTVNVKVQKKMDAICVSGGTGHYCCR